jgi:hypothetical protein
MEGKSFDEKNKIHFKRYFSVMALTELSILGMSFNDLLVM